MKYFAVISHMKDSNKNKQYYSEHVKYLIRQREIGNIFATGRFTDGKGGLAIYMANSLEDVTYLAQNDPYVLYGARVIEVHEWEAVIGKQY